MSCNLISIPECCVAAGGEDRCACRCHAAEVIANLRAAVAMRHELPLHVEEVDSPDGVFARGTGGNPANESPDRRHVDQHGEIAVQRLTVTPEEFAKLQAAGAVQIVQVTPEEMERMLKGGK